MVLRLFVDLSPVNIVLNFLDFFRDSQSESKPDERFLSIERFTALYLIQYSVC